MSRARKCSKWVEVDTGIVRSEGVSQRTMPGAASISGRASAKVLLFKNARNRLVCVIWAGWLYQEAVMLVEALSCRAFVRMDRNI